jgi:hypothetical protein
MCLCEGVGRLLFKRNMLKGDLSLNVKVLYEIKFDGKVLHLSVLDVNNMTDCRLYISLEGKWVDAWHGKL